MKLYSETMKNILTNSFPKKLKCVEKIGSVWLTDRK